MSTLLTKSPAERYIKYLILRYPGMNTEALMDQLDEQGLEPLGPDYLVRVRNLLNPPQPFRPRSGHKASLVYLGSLGIAELYNKTSDSEMALEILASGRGKEHVETMVIAGMPVDMLARSLGHHGFPGVSARTVELYISWFWDVVTLSSMQKRILVDIRKNAIVRSRSPEVHAQADALKKASYHDPLKAAANMPSSSVTALIAQVQAGYMPSETDINKILRTTRTVLAMRGLELALTNPKDMSLMVQGIHGTIESIDRTLERSVDPTEQIRRQIQSITLRHDPSALPDLNDLSGGNHTKQLLVGTDSGGLGMDDEEDEADDASP